MGGLPPDIHSRFDELAAGKRGIGVYDEEDISIVRLFCNEDEEGDEDPKAQASRPSSTLSGGPSSPSLEYRLIHLCKNGERDWFNGKRLIPYRPWETACPHDPNMLGGG